MNKKEFANKVAKLGEEAMKYDYEAAAGLLFALAGCLGRGTDRELLHSCADFIQKELAELNELKAKQN